jgi:SAM-dependent methyltransferase
LVFTGIGAICWLPSIDRWADNVVRLLRPGGRLFIREGHPILWAVGDPTIDDPALIIDHPYFETETPEVFDEAGTYVTTDREFTSTTTHSWNHGIGEILSSLIERNMTITSFVEHDSVPWEALPGLMVREDLGEWRLIDRRERLPMSYTLTAVLNG